MTILLDQRADGSCSLYIDGDLQFDTRDERAYHEALALPALALTERRAPGPLRALICGGGDGLAARELLKSPRLARLDLVDYDPAVLAFARGELSALNGRSLSDPRTYVAVEDAWLFAERAALAGTCYDLIVSDLVVPQDMAGARLHSIEWYERLRALLGQAGVLAINCASPSFTPEAFWSIYNGVRAAGLHARPYRIALPSFTAMGYGDDWGFLLASPQPITSGELGDDLALAGPRAELRGPAQLRRLFHFPAEIAERRADAHPTRLGSPLLLHYLSNGATPAPGQGASWDALGFEHDPLPPPAADTGAGLLPAELQGALAKPPGSRADEETLLRRVLKLMPALRPFQTREMIATFLDAPERFLAAIDLPALVDRLLRRAAELPRRLVAELRLLRARLRDLAGNHAALLRLGTRILTIVALVVILANLVYPDMVYGKGGDGGSAGGDSASFASPAHGVYNPNAAPELATGGGFRDPNFGRGTAVDEAGSPYPPRRYRYFPHYFGHRGYTSHRQGQPPDEPPEESETAYKLTPDADVLPDGKVVVALTEQTYLLLGDEVFTVIDQQSGQPLLFLDRDPALIWRVAHELERQSLGLQQSARSKQVWISWMSWLEFAPWHDDDTRELANLQAMAGRLELARTQLGGVPASAPPAPTPPLPGAAELFSGAWILPDASGLALRLPEGLVFLDGKGWYRDAERTSAWADPYPAEFKTFVTGYLARQVADAAAIRARLTSDLTEVKSELAALTQDKSEYDTIARTDSPDSFVEYGSTSIPLREAQRRTNDDLAHAQQAATALEQQIATLPQETALAERLAANLGQ